ncbi:MAG: class I SAM-dependent methyltransferase [Lapillicoccus sp.]
MAASSSLSRVKHAYAVAAQSVGRVLTRTGVLGETAPPIEQTGRHWAFSLTRVHDSIAIAQLDVPWWTYRSIDAVSLWLSTRSTPLRAYEYGSGASTFWLARRFAEVESVEHHLGFGEMMQGELGSFSNVKLRLIEPAAARDPGIGSEKEGHAGLDFTDYVRSIDAVDGQFDLIVIDGRAREACLTASVPRLAEGGIIVYDNSRRPRYRRAIEASGMVEHRYRGLTPTLPYPDQTSLLTAR